MASEIIMPKAGMVMEEGKIVRWLKNEGDSVERGEVILEIETDKVNMEIEAEASGTLIKILNEEGDTVPVTHVIGYIGETGEKIESAPLPENETEEQKNGVETTVMARLPKHERVPATPLAKTIANQRGIPLEGIRPGGRSGEITANDVLSAKYSVTTPLAKRVAEGIGADISSVSGSGLNGRIFKEDVLRTQYAQEKETRPLSGMRKAIAKNMLQNHLQIPPVTLHAKADVTELCAMRNKINESAEVKITFNDMLIKAAATALRQCPDINVSFADDHIVKHKHINIGMAVSLPDGLIVPVIKDADWLTLREIGDLTKTLADKARSGKLMPDDYTGGTFTITNLGMYGITGFTPIINMPESAILGVCAIEDVLALDDRGSVYKRSVMGLSLTFDHRSIDGAQAAVFLKTICGMLANPLRMLI